MEQIINYLDIPLQNRDAVIEQLSCVGFSPASGKQKTMKREMDQSQAGKLPQYLFVFRDGKLIGYMFLISENENYSKTFPWWAVDNSDELPLNTAIQLLEYGINLSLECGYVNLADRLKTELEYQKKGIGRRSENICR